MNKQCRECNFYVNESQDYCPNCGIIEPQYGESNRELFENLERDRKERYLPMDKKRQEMKRSYNIKKKIFIPIIYLISLVLLSYLICIVLFLVSYIASIVYDSKKLDIIEISEMLKSLIFSVYTSWRGLLGIPLIVGTNICLWDSESGFRLYNSVKNLFLDKKITLEIRELESSFEEENKIIDEENKKKQEYYSSRSNTSYQKREKLIEQELENIMAEINRLESLTKENESEINQSNSERAKSRLSRLKQGLKIYQQEQEDYLVEQWDIWLRRWTNQLERFRYGARSIKNLTNSIQSLKQIEQEGIATLEEWRKRSLSSGAKYIQYLDKTLQTCQRIREDLRDEEAANALRDVKILKNPEFNLSGWDDLFSTLDTLNNLPDVGAFSSGQEALEEEAIRLESEEEVNNISKSLNHKDSI